MRMNVKLSSLLRQAAQWRESVSVQADTPARCLQALIDLYPDMRKWMFDKDGNPWDRLQLFVNGEMIHREEYTRPLCESDELFVLLNIGGG
jgi:hypothetical protein